MTLVGSLVLRSSSSRPTHSERVASYLRGVRDVSYFPTDAGWANMWTDWQPGRIRGDLAKIAGLGATTVRAIIPPFTFGWHTPTPTMQNEFDRFVGMARAAGLTVQVTLFDLFGNYHQISQSVTFATSLLARYRNSAAIAFVEVQDEINPANAAAMEWLRTMVPAVKKIVGTVPVTVSTAGADGVSGVLALRRALAGHPPDFYDFHYYGTAGLAYTTLAAVKAVVAPAPLFIGESGASTTDPGAGAAALQAGFYYSVEAATRDLDLPPAGVWTFTDFDRATIPASLPNSEMYFGLSRTAGTPKPAATAVRTAFTTRPGPLPNPSFETTTDGIPIGWVPTDSTNGSLAVATAVAHTGHHSLLITDTGGTTDTEPAWTTTVNTGRIVAGTRYRATVWAEGKANTGQTLIALAWFDASNHFLDNSTSLALPVGNTNWMQLGVDATAPPGAAYAQISLQCYQNTGTAWFDDATFSRLRPPSAP